MKTLLVSLLAIIIIMAYACEKDPITDPTPNPTKPVASFTAPDTIILDTATSTFTFKPINTSTGATSYLWTLGTMTSTLADPEFVLTTPGEMTLKLVATNSGGSSEFSKNIIVKNADCVFKIKIICPNFFHAAVYYWGDVKVESHLLSDFSFSLPSENYGKTIDDMMVLVQTYTLPNGKWYTISSFAIKYSNSFTITTTN
jgi:PKD repeat protein